MRFVSMTALLVSAALASAQTPDARQEVHGYLGRQGFDATAITRLEAGEVVAQAADGRGADREISVVATVKIRVPRAQVASYYGQMIAHVDGQVTLAFGRFSSPPAIDDVKNLSFDRDEIDQLNRN